MQYERTSLVEAKPMTRGEYNSYRGFGSYPDEDLNEPGFLVTADNGKFLWIDSKNFMLNHKPMES